jgi:hypothetical protein
MDKSGQDSKSERQAFQVLWQASLVRTWVEPTNQPFRSSVGIGHILCFLPTQLSFTADDMQLEFTCEELCASVAEAPIGIRVGDDGDNDVIHRANSPFRIPFWTKSLE